MWIENGGCQQGKKLPFPILLAQNRKQNGCGVRSRPICGGVANTIDTRPTKRRPVLETCQAGQLPIIRPSSMDGEFYDRFYRTDALGATQRAAFTRHVR